ncbi:MAG: acetyltransferase [Planctomycetes bacterium]|nr:acetyltransferase [Planctomycetota bacterium]
MKNLHNYDIFLVGGGGHARVLLDIISLVHPDWQVAVLDSDRARYGTQIMGAHILGGDDLMKEISAEIAGARFSVSLGSVGDCGPRRRLFDQALALGLSPEILIHPAAIVSRFARVREGTQLLPACVVNAGASIGRNVIVNSGAVVEHDCVVMDHAHIATGASLASAVTVGEGAHIGVGASVRQGVRIGDGALVGAGAAIVKDVPPGAVVVGVPARPLREKKDSEIL